MTSEHHTGTPGSETRGEDITQEDEVTVQDQQQENVTTEEVAPEATEDDGADLGVQSVGEAMLAPGSRVEYGDMNMARLAVMMPVHLREALEAGTLPPAEPDPADDVLAVKREQLAKDRAGLWSLAVQEWADEDDYSQAKIADLAPDQHPDDIIAWIKDDASRMLILAGSVGAGKTHAAFAVLNGYAARAGAYCWAVNHRGYLDSLRPDGGPEAAWLHRRRCQSADVLLIDEFGAGLDPECRVSEFVSAETTTLISGRLKHGKKTVVTTNLSLRDLEVMFNDRLLSRMRKSSVALPFTGGDRRSVGATW